jgi:mRNA interferase RelE/StbE
MVYCNKETYGDYGVVHWHKQALKQMADLTKSRRDQIRKAVDGLPGSGDIRKLQGYQNTYRLRVGIYRIIYRLSDNDIYIDGVLPRGNAYKN